ncbi:hypothetical protein AB6A40_006310 [Gnathostoma spinigerum]|uniref:C2H2-type domain-containing protein n=1 Tax=Gnathostoma spinigerum TaxID=75299 RepID=A0ABD6EQ97_9BILA
MIRLSSLTGFSAINAATSFAQQQRCSLCDYVSLNIDDLLRHQVSHLISDPVNSPLSSICNSVDNVVALNNTDDINSKLHGNIDLRQLIGKPEVNVKLKPFLSVLEQSEVAEHDQMLSVDADGDTQVNDSSDDQHQSPTESSKSCCEDGQSSSTEDISEKGARKRKAALKLSQIAARLHEKNSPGIEDGTHSEASDTTVDVASEMRNRRTAGLTDTRASSRDPLAESHQTVNVNPTIPLIRPVPGGINIFQQACLAQMHDMEQKLRTAIGMWRFSCPHCRIAFHDEPLFHIHMGYHGYENAFKCNRCGQSCSDCLTFNLHLLQAKH